MKDAFKSEQDKQKRMLGNKKAQELTIHML